MLVLGFAALCALLVVLAFAGVALWLLCVAVLDALLRRGR